MGGGLVRVRMDLAYDGTAFHGWARQPGLRTVQGVVETALSTAAGTEVTGTVCAGRTDAGVHALGQVAHADLPGWAPELVRRVRGLLPDDVRLHAMAPAPEGFDARFSARDRRYAYRLCDDPSRCDPILRASVLDHHRPLDLDAMNAAAARLVGEHDFAAFCRPRAGASTVRTLARLEWHRDNAGLAVMTAVADAFCHSMVRALVGSLLPVGDGRRDDGWPAQVLAARQRDPAVTVAPPHGLTLCEVRYPPDAELAEQQRRTRVFRGSP